MGSANSTPDELSSKINRNPDSIRKYIKKHGLNVRGTEEQKGYAESSFIGTEYWTSLQERYNKIEQGLFLVHYKEIVGQFQNEVPYTEMLQIIDYIHAEIEIQRSTVLKRQVLESIARLNKDIDKIRRTKSGDEVIEYEDLICQKESSLNHIGKDTLAWLDKKEKSAKSLKATRGERVQRIESAKTTFSGLVIELMSDPEKMRAVGIDIEKHRVATDVQYQMLHNLHEYKDGGVDPPILNADSVMGLDDSKFKHLQLGFQQEDKEDGDKE
jgi:hypothetical protein